MTSASSMGALPPPVLGRVEFMPKFGLGMDLESNRVGFVKGLVRPADHNGLRRMTPYRIGVCLSGKYKRFAICRGSPRYVVKKGYK